MKTITSSLFFEDINQGEYAGMERLWHAGEIMIFLVETLL